jgi:hypothetical protein
LYSALPIVSIREDHPWNRTENNCIKKSFFFSMAGTILSNTAREIGKIRKVALNESI